MKAKILFLLTVVILMTACDSDTVSQMVSLRTSAPENVRFLIGLSLLDAGLSFDENLGVVCDTQHYTQDQIRAGIGYNAQDRREVFSGKTPYFDGGASVTQYTSKKTYLASPLGVFQVFKKADLTSGMIRVGYYNYLCTYNRTDFNYASDAYFDRYYYFDSQTVKPFVCWEDDEYLVCNWQSLFIPEEYAEWLRDVIPLEQVEPIDGEGFIQENSAAKESFDESLNFIRKP